MANINAYRMTFRPFAALVGDELYDMLKLRFDVFILEQESLYPELDGADKSAVHCLANVGGALAATLRIIGLDGQGPVVIGRVAVHQDHRGTGLGRQMMRAALNHVEAKAPGRAITLGAQLHLEGFYGSLGFLRCSDIYDDGGIDHVDMTRSPAKVGA
ncbi:MAG: GNAT family N-acetyltransferase [Pseudomonadota bacterium]